MSWTLKIIASEKYLTVKANNNFQKQHFEKKVPLPFPKKKIVEAKKVVKK